MGISLGCIKFNDGTILFAGYQNTADIMNHCLWNNTENVFSKYTDNRKNCICDDNESVLIATNYGDGFYWSGFACKNCMLITKNCSPLPIERWDGTTIEPEPDFYKSGLPNWWPV